MPWGILRNLFGAAVLIGLLFVLHRLWPEGFAVRGTAALGAVSSVDRPQDEAPANPLRVLFIGNSHTFGNRMPDLIAGLARGVNTERPLEYVMEAPGGANFEGHLQSGNAQKRLSTGRWDFVVLQEQQQRSSFTFNAAQMEREFYGPARTLDILIRAAGAKTILYMTAARRDGDPSNVPGDTYEKMQERTREGYSALAEKIGATVAPAGLAWRWVRRERPDMQLWEPDGSHPSLHGSYLIACTLYAVLYGRSPRDNAFTAGLPVEDARLLQRAADAARFL